MADKGKRNCAADDSDEEPDSLLFKSLLKPDSLLFKSKLKPDSTIIQTLEAYKSDAAAASSPVKSPTLAELYPDTAFLDIGVVVGRLSFSEDGDTIDCTKMGEGGKGIPTNIDLVGDMQSDALFILLVGKHATFMRLAEGRFYNRFPCIIVNAEGKPDVWTWQFLRKMKVELKLPVLALVDSDPDGLHILSVYSRGSTSDIKWLGIRPSDLDKYKIPERCRRPMTKRDIKYGKALLKEDFVKKNRGWVKELNVMMKSKKKAEIFALSSLGLKFLTEVYLPLKLQEKDWV